VAEKKRELPMAQPGGLKRREVLQGLFAGVGASVAIPGSAEPHPMTPAVTAAHAKAKSTDWKAEFLDEHQLATVALLCALIVPGSEKAGTDRFIDSLLAADHRDRQRRFLTALGALEGEALKRFSQSFRGLTGAQQVEILTAAAAGDPGRPEWVWKPGTLLEEPEAPDEVPVTLRDHFDHLKTAIVEAYYSSEQGLKELGDTGQMFYATFPDCTHESHG
jgi:hypothetical protein